MGVCRARTRREGSTRRVVVARSRRRSSIDRSSGFVVRVERRRERDAGGTNRDSVASAPGLCSPSRSVVSNTRT